MTVKRIVPDFELAKPAEATGFYQDVLGMEMAMDLGWIVTFQAPDGAQISIASQGGNGSMVPDASIEVEDVDEVYRKATAAGHEIVYDLCDEVWGVRRFFVREPTGKVLNILSHKK